LSRSVLTAISPASGSDPEKLEELAASIKGKRDYSAAGGDTKRGVL